MSFGFDGYHPLPGDMVERYGIVTGYVLAAGTGPDGVAPHGLYIALHESGYMVLRPAEPDGSPRRAILGGASPDGERRPFDAPFTVDGLELCFTIETIRDVLPDGSDITWTADVCVPASVDHTHTIWSDAYRRRSEARQRTSESTARHKRRVRLAEATVEPVDPAVVFDRDGWTCKLCGDPVGQDVAWPDVLSPSLDHVIPLSLGGDHSYENTQLAHWICNVRKGATRPLG